MKETKSNVFLRTIIGTNYYRKDEGVGEWGGTCTCPDGQTYEVGDNYDACATLACEGGTAGQCYRDRKRVGAQMKVTCETGN